MIFCMNCGNKLTVGYQFCTHCGEVQEQGMPINSQVIPPVSIEQQGLVPHVNHQAMPTSVQPQDSNTDYMGNLIIRGCGTDARSKSSDFVWIIVVRVALFIVAQIVISVLSGYYVGGYRVWIHGLIIPPSLFRVASFFRYYCYLVLDLVQQIMPRIRNISFRKWYPRKNHRKIIFRI